MKITQISLTNFRSFQDTQTIDIAPLTLLFGPNSVGKSSVLMALFYLQQILKNGQCDPIRLEALGDKYVGGFKNLVNGRDLGKRIILRIDTNKKGEIGSSYNFINEVFDQNFGLTPDSPTADADNIAVEFHIGWSKTAETAYIACYKIWLGERLIAELTTDSGMKQPMVNFIDYSHPALICDDDMDLAENYELGGYISQFHQLINEHRSLGNTPQIKSAEGKELIHEPISFKGFAGALPKLGHTLETALELDDRLRNARVHEILSDVVVAPLDNLLALLNESLCIGPLRVVPDALHQTNPYPQQKDWYTGAAAWDVTGKSSCKTEEINYWLNGEHSLNLGYSIRRKSVVSNSAYTGSGNNVRELLAAFESFGEEIEITISKENLDENPEAEQFPVDKQKLLEYLREQKEKTDITTNEIHPGKEITRTSVLWDDINNIEVSSSDIGVGVSQLFPLVAASVERQYGIIACEQPELHVHPRVQVGIGDLLTQNKKQTTFLIETHSEHLILRILKRIRQTSENELPEGVKPVYPNDVSIIYMEPTECGVITRKINIDGDGEFDSHWPHGFFSERREELM